MSYQLTIIQGNLTRDAAIKYIGDTQVARFTLATSRKKKDATGAYVDVSDFWDVEVWGNQAKACGEFLKKGNAALAQGTLVLQEWPDQATGINKQKYVLKADKVVFLSSRKKEEPTSERLNETDVDELGLPF